MTSSSHISKILAGFSTIAVLLGAAVAHAQGAPGDSDSVVVISLEGKLESAPAGTENWTPVAVNQTLRPGDRLRTGRNSRATLRSAAAGEETVREEGIFTINPPRAGSTRPVFELVRGWYYFFTRGQPLDIELRNRLASAASRQTEFLVVVGEDDKVEITVFDGVVDLTNAQGGVVINKGERGVAVPGQPPTTAPALNATNLIQWVLYYPGVLDTDELPWDNGAKDALRDSIEAYRTGDLVRALNSYPSDRVAITDVEKTYYAALLLVVGEAEKAEKTLDSLTQASRFSAALRKLIAAVRNDPAPDNAPPSSATEWISESYYRQSRLDLEGALAAAHSATQASPEFGFAWARVAELEFSFGRIDAARAALEKALALSPLHAAALALRGFLLAAENKIPEAIVQFDKAIAVDGAFADAWLGRGLCRIRRGDESGGREDLRTAAALVPTRAVFRSYLAKAFSDAGRTQLAERELNLSRQMDPNDPTVWLYSALHHQQQNRINQAIRELERSQELNNNRAVYRSEMLLDQDRAVRSANLAGIYNDAGMTEVSVREAGRAVSSDYANYSAHLFLANSYERLRDPKQINQRYETPALAEYLIANLLAPVGAGLLSPAISQQEYSKLFERDRFGVSSTTEYQSSGNWYQNGAQYGTFGNMSYSVEGLYRSDHGQRHNNDLEQRVLSAQVKQQITAHDTIYLSVTDYRATSGDVTQRYDQDDGNPGVRTREEHEPDMFLGYHREWAPGQHTLLLGAVLNDKLARRDPFQELEVLSRNANGGIDDALTGSTRENYHTRFKLFSGELQQIVQTENFTFVAGGRFQTGEFRTQATQNGLEVLAFPGFPYAYGTQRSISPDFQRITFYSYNTWNVTRSVQLVAGMAYDHLTLPTNFRASPIEEGDDTTSRFSPKAGLVWTADKDTTLRLAYAQGVTGVSVDQSTQIEPSQVAGFNQSFRSVIPESAGGSSAGERYEAAGVSLERKFPTDTYAILAGEWLSSEQHRTIGAGRFGPSAMPTPVFPDRLRQHVEFSERSLLFTLNQLVDEDWALGARYRVSHADSKIKYPDFNPAPGADTVLKRSTRFDSVLHQVTLYAIYNHSSGLFAQAQTVWTAQDNNDGFKGTEPGDDFWHCNLFAGYRFWRRRAEVSVGVLNIGDRDYKLEPLTLYNELPRERTFVARLSLKF
ncbi:MAG: TonB-dependent receptor [Akkermansiaceae bacterium]|nr:TonB-dependent receptor [Verrucomicrobiales bacterium]